MSIYEFGVTCPRDGEPMVHLTASRPMDCGLRSTAIVKCPKPGCRREYQIVTELIICGDSTPVPQPLKEAV